MMRKTLKTMSFGIFLILSFQLILFAQQSKIKSYQELKFTSIDKQVNEYTCGAAALSTIFNYFYNSTENQIDIFQTVIGKEEEIGLTFLDMKNYSVSKGFNAIAYKMKYSDLVEQLQKENIPLILHLNVPTRYKELKHFSVGIGVIGNYIILDDSAKGIWVLSENEFISIWTGFVLIVRPKENNREEREKSHETIQKQKKAVFQNLARFYTYEKTIY